MHLQTLRSRRLGERPKSQPTEERVDPQRHLAALEQPDALTRVEVEGDHRRAVELGTEVQQPLTQMRQHDVADADVVVEQLPLRRPGAREHDALRGCGSRAGVRPPSALRSCLRRPRWLFLPARIDFAARLTADEGAYADRRSRCSVRGFTTGWSKRSSCGRRRSCCWGRRSSSPRRSGSSSTAKPGDVVAISKRIPCGWRK